eukprot:gene1088-1025_t
MEVQSRRVWDITNTGHDALAATSQSISSPFLDKNRTSSSREQLVGKQMSVESIGPPERSRRSLASYIAPWRFRRGQTFSFWRGAGHVQMGVRSVMMWFQITATALTIYWNIDVYHNWVILILQAVNSLSLLHQSYTNWRGDFLLRSFSTLLRAVSLFHAATCGRRSFFAFFWTEEEVWDDYEHAVKLGYPKYLPVDSRVCFDLDNVDQTQVRDISIDDGDQDSVDVLRPFRMLLYVAFFLQLCYSFNLFLHTMFPTFMEVTRPKAEIEGDPSDSDDSCRKYGESKFDFTFVHLFTLFDMPPKIASKHGQNGKRVRGAIWIWLRAFLALMLAFVQIAAAVMKHVLVPEESFFKRTTEEIAVNILRAVFRLLAAWSLYIQYWKPATGWEMTV